MSSSEVDLPPHSLEAEQSILGGLMLDNLMWDRVVDILRSEIFYRDDHRRIFRHISLLLNSSSPADVVTVSESLQRSEELELIGGLGYLSQLARNTPSVANIAHYALIVRDKAILRQLINVGHKIVESSFHSEGRDARMLLDEAERRVFEIAENGGREAQGFSSIRPILEGVLSRIQDLHESGAGDITGVPSGFTDLDRMTSGLQPGDLIIIAGRPSMGKTAFAINIAEYVALENGLPVGIFSMEMASSQVVMRMLSSIGNVNQQKIRVGNLNDDEWGRVTQAYNRLESSPIHIDESAALTTLEVRARSRRLHRHYGGQLGLIVVDYLQLMASVNNRSDNRATEIAEISRSLKALAKELNCPVIALSQLSRRVEERADKRPMMIDLRESGAIEQDADVILMLYRDEYYNKDSKEKGQAEIIIGKQRNGPVGSVRVAFRGEYTRFDNLALSYRIGHS